MLDKTSKERSICGLPGFHHQRDDTTRKHEGEINRGLLLPLGTTLELKTRAVWTLNDFKRKVTDLLLWFSSVIQCMFCMCEAPGDGEEREIEKHRDTGKVGGREQTFRNKKKIYRGNVKDQWVPGSCGEEEKHDQVGHRRLSGQRASLYVTLSC